MQEIKDYEKLLSHIEQIPVEKIKKPQYPIAIYIQEATNRCLWAEDDRDALAERGLDSSLLDDLPVRLNALRIAEAYWYKKQYAASDVKKKYEILKAEAVELRLEAIESFRFALHEDKYEYERMTKYKNKVADPQLIQELNDLSYFGKHCNRQLQRINFNLSKLERMAELSGILATATALYHGEILRKSEVLNIRNKAFTYMKMADDEICRAGRYVFANIPDRLRGYTSDYRREHR